MQDVIHRQEVVLSISFCIRELGNGVLHPSQIAVEKYLLSAINRIAKAQYSDASSLLHKAMKSASFNSILPLHIERAELLLERWLEQRPEKDELPHSVDTRNIQTDH